MTTKNRPPKAKRDQPEKGSIKPFPPRVQEILKASERALEVDKNEKRYHHFDTYDEVLENLDGLAEAHNDYRHKLGFKEEK